MRCLATTILIGLLAPCAAQASEVARDEGVLSLRGDRSDSRVRVRERRRSIVIRDKSGGIAVKSGADCRPGRRGRLVCSVAGIRKLSLILGGGADRATVEGTEVEGLDVSVEGGSGADDIAVVTSGAIAISGGAGNDREEAAVSGEASSVIVSGNGGDDALTNRSLQPSSGISNLSGNQGADMLVGSDVDDDLLDGGPGADLFLGRGGSDTLLARDNEADQGLACDDEYSAAGGQSDRAVVDTLDPEPSGCETVDRP